MKKNNSYVYIMLLMVGLIFLILFSIPLILNPIKSFFMIIGVIIGLIFVVLPIIYLKGLKNLDSNSKKEILKKDKLKKEKNSPETILILALFGFILLMFPLISIIKIQNMEKNYKKITATISNVKVDEFNSATVRFDYKVGETYYQAKLTSNPCSFLGEESGFRKTCNSYFSNYSNFEKNKKIKVYYKENNPYEVRYLNDVTTTTYITLLCGLVLEVIAVYMLITKTIFIKKLQKKYIKH